jgi:phosphohistidine swiveling domain-containing protein
MKWSRYARREHAPLSARLLQVAQRAPYFQDTTGIAAGLANHVWVNDSIYIPDEEQELLKRAVQRQLGENWSVLDEFCRRCRIVLERLSTAAQTFNESLEADPLAATTNWFDAYQAAMAFVPVFRTIDRVLAEHITAEEASTFLSDGYSASSLTKEAAERSDLQLLVEKLRSRGDLTASSDLAEELLRVHAKNYAWLRTRWFLGEPFTIADFRDRAAALLVFPPQHSGRHADETATTTERSANAHLLDELAYLRTHRAEAINEAIWQVRESFTALAAVNDISFKEFVYLYPHEILDLVTGGRAPVARARQRHVSFATALLNDDFTDAAGRAEVEAFAVRLKFASSQQRSISADTEVLLTGVAASTGEAIGPVRIVPAAQDADDLREGEVLVTTMTYPSMVAAMQRAAAIVTDDGGLLSHAAVTARELGKPCVIDTGNATSLLRNGDVVHVRTDPAVVQRLSPTPQSKEES